MKSWKRELIFEENIFPLDRELSHTIIWKKDRLKRKMNIDYFDGKWYNTLGNYWSEEELEEKAEYIKEDIWLK